jgi:histidinol dehydrogenase
MQVIKHPSREDWASLIARPVFDSTTLFDTVQKVLDDVRKNGDKAVKDYTLKFDGVMLDTLEVTQEEIAEAEKLISMNLKQAIEMARRNIWKFHSEQQQGYSNRKSWFVCAGWHCAIVFYCFDAWNTGSNC